MRFRIKILVLYLLILPVMQGCASTPPVQEMSDARSAIAAAQRLQSEQRAPEALRMAEDLLNKAQIEMEVHNYGLARQYARQAKDAAVQARVKAQAESAKPAAAKP